MNKIIGVLALAFSLAISVVMADSWDDSIAKAQGLKKAGDYIGAAEATPRTLCKAIYYWNAACKVVGHKDANGDWAINATVSPADKTEGLRLLKLASDNLDNAVQGAGLTAPDDGTCKGVDVNDLKDLIQKVKDCAEGHCQ